MPFKTMQTLTRTTRRSFLSRAVQAALAGAALPQIVPSGVLAADGVPGANDRIGVGIIGIGRQASDLLRNLLRLPAARYVAVADINLKRARASAQEHGATAFKDYRQLLDQKSVDAVITATPEHWRSLICIHACQAGKDIYAEKPVSLTIREGRLMVEAARKYRRVFQVGSQQRSDWTDVAACRFVREGGLGKIRKVYVWNYPSPWECGLPAQPVPEDLDWAMWCGPAGLADFNQDLYLPRAKPGWLSFRPYSGGEMTGWGAHGFDMIQAALGMDESGPTEIWTEGPRFETLKYLQAETSERGNSICNKPKVFFRYPGDIVMELVDKTPFGEKPPPFGGYVVGERGQLKIDRGRIDSDPDQIAEGIMKKRPAGYDGNHLGNWLKCVRSRQKPNADIEIGHRSATICHLGNIARWVGRPLKWDAVKEQFTNDSEANACLDRPRRSPWELPKI